MARTDQAHSYRWTVEDLRILRECQQLSGLTETQTIREALKEWLPRLRKKVERTATSPAE
jgi:hypothetical protein